METVMRSFVCCEIEKSQLVLQKMLCSEQIHATLESVAETCVGSLRHDGKILTTDCPQGLARIRHASRRARARILSALAAAISLGAAALTLSRTREPSIEAEPAGAQQPHHAVAEAIRPRPAVPAPRGQWLGGRLCTPE